MRILIIGGTGTISSAITRQLAESGHELWLLNRGNRKNEVPQCVTQVIADIDDTNSVLRMLGDTMFDAVCEFIGFVPSQARENPPADIGMYKPGDHVQHRKFGVGEVQEVVGNGPDARIRIEFTAYGMREFVLSLAPIAKLEE